ncbi:hypothetical protein [Nonomuraea sp. NPDC003804]|uniref:hypothetical protein n=1 Tax=Nonomuraea sp. NPDC003804 TaxID=3154547 RepID=UPI0033AC3FC3
MTEFRRVKASGGRDDETPAPDVRCPVCGAAIEKAHTPVVGREVNPVHPPSYASASPSPHTAKRSRKTLSGMVKPGLTSFAARDFFLRQ